MSSIGGISQGSGYQSLYGKISSGKKLQTAADGAAELAISEKMNSQVRGLEQGSKNVSSGIDAIKIQDSALGEVTDYLQRIKELAVAASNSFTVGDSDKAIYQKEIDQLKEGIQNVASVTTYNEKNLLDGSTGDLEITTDGNGGSVKIKGADSTLESLGIKDFDVTGDFDLKDIDKALEKVSSMRSDAGATQNSLEHLYNINQIGVYNVTASQSRLEDLDVAKAVGNLDKQRLLDTISVMMQKKREEEEENKMGRLFH
jgi:flagellin